MWQELEGNGPVMQPAVENAARLLLQADQALEARCLTDTGVGAGGSAGDKPGAS